MAFVRPPFFCIFLGRRSAGTLAFYSSSQNNRDEKSQGYPFCFLFISVFSLWIGHNELPGRKLVRSMIKKSGAFLGEWVLAFIFRGLLVDRFFSSYYCYCLYGVGDLTAEKALMSKVVWGEGRLVWLNWRGHPHLIKGEEWSACCLFARGVFPPKTLALNRR